MHRGAAAQLGRLEHRQVDALESRAIERVAFEVAERAGRRRREGGRIEVLHRERRGGRLHDAGVRIADQVRAIGADAGAAGVGAGRDGERRSARERRDGVDLPAVAEPADPHAGRL